MREWGEVGAGAVAAAAEEVCGGRRVPDATYRLQFCREFGFRDAMALVPYLHDLGISDCYASPLLRSRSESSHGYDVCDHGRLNPALGSEKDFDALVAELRGRGMGLLLDMVPNHMAIGEACNQAWMDVLENGPGSSSASWFDIDWHPVKQELQDTVLLPILEDQYGRVLESGRFRLAYEEGAFSIYYYEHKLPVAPHSYGRILGYRLDALVQALGEDHEQVRELRSILTALSYLPPRTELAPEKVAERNREKEVIKRRIATLYRASADVRAAIDTALRAFAGTPGDPRSFDLLDALLSEQAYRPAYWRVAAEEINYRRFFDINDLVAIRVEVPEVFQATHQLVLRWLAEGRVTGLRVDHPDGLWNPESYFLRLQESYLLSRIRDRLEGDAPPERLESDVSEWLARRMESGRGADPPLPLYVVAEKILAGNEPLPESWAVDGTTGYDFLNTVNGLFVDDGNRKAMDRAYSGFLGTELSFHNLMNSNKKMIMLISLASEVNALAHQLERIAEKNRWYRDFTLNSLTFALREVIAALPVYRTYITGPESVRPLDVEYVAAAVAEARRRNPRTAATIFDFVRDTLLLRNLQDFEEEDRRSLVDWVMKFQQVTGPVMAKGLEDTTFYVYNRLISLNEVGGEPARFGVSVPEFHEKNEERRRRWPHSLLATSTHDTKRSEDVRARIDVLSEIPEEWRSAVTRWGRMNASKKVWVDGELAPDRNDEYLLYQTLLGAWPEAEARSVLSSEADLVGVPRSARPGDAEPGRSGPHPRAPMSSGEYARFRDRIAAYMLKATKEAKVHTSWVNANEEYDAAVQAFVRRLLVDDPEDPFLQDLLALQRRVAFFGRFNSLSQLLLKLASPGVPDIYQGTELWDLSLVDPDNRRPVDYERRRLALAGLRERARREGNNLVPLARELLQAASDGRIKMYVTYRVLTFRRAHRELFAEGSYLPLDVQAYQREHVCAFARTLEGEAVVVAVPRLVAKLTGGVERPPLGEDLWKDTWLSVPRSAAGRRDTRPYRNLFTGEVLPVAERHGVAGIAASAVFAHFPVALLERIPE